MKKSLLLFSMSLLGTSLVYGQQACTYTDAGSGSTYSLGSGEILCITSGTFTGTLSNWPADASVVISAGATFAPAPLGNAQGMVLNRGTVILNGSHLLNTGFSLVNEDHATTEIQTAPLLGGAIRITNDVSSTLNLQVPLSLPPGSNFANEGIVNSYGAFESGSNGLFSNDGVMNVYGNLTCRGTAFNTGILKVYGFSELPAGSQLINKCTFLSEKSFTNNSEHIENHGFIQIFGSGADAAFLNQQDLYNDAKGIVQCRDFINTASVTGAGQFLVSGYSSNSGPFGQDGFGINFYDASPNGNQVFDAQASAPHFTVTKDPVPAYDTTYISQSCNQIAFPQDANGALPVTLESFTALNRDCRIVVEWITSSEQNSAAFEIERRGPDDDNFHAVATLKAAGFANTPTLYSFTDEELPANAVYQYRLRMTDLDGRFSYSRVSSLNLFCGNTNGINLYPNPSQGDINLSFQTTDADTYLLRAVDMTGRTLWQQAYDFNAGFQHISLPLGQLPAGHYSLLISNSLHTEAKAFTRY